MPRFGGFNTGNIGGALARNALGSVANAVLPRTPFKGFGVNDSKSISYPQQNAQDRMVSLRPKPAAANRVYGNGLLKPLKDAGGLIWPYTPSISYPHPITYESVSVTHANQDFHIYSRTPAVTLQVSGEFTVQNPQEGAYALAAIHFLRTMAKMHFGETDLQAGTPPPVLLFNAYGPFVFKDVPVIVKEFNVEFPQDVDYVQVNIQGVNTQTTPGGAARREGDITQENLPPVNPGGYPPQVLETLERLRGGNIPSPNRLIPGRIIPGSGSPATSSAVPQTYTVWLPAVFKISCGLTVQHTPDELRKRFNLPKYINGDASQKDFI
jgi:hypothetical protein